MSASLVGSEMCIRDSQSGPEEQGRRAVGFLADVPGAANTLLERQPVSVSYTHLTLPTICSV
eukprot:12393759-Alexandrium_andersonii.AAC.1